MTRRVVQAVVPPDLGPLLDAERRRREADAGIPVSESALVVALLRDALRPPRADVPAEVVAIDGHLALVQPDDGSTAPASVRLGVWLPRRDWTVGTRGHLVWHDSPTRGAWHFAPVR